MGKIILSGATAYISTSIDYLIILMLIFSQVRSHKQRWAVYLGDLLGTGTLVLAALILAFILHLVPAEWVLGILGIIPILMGLKLLIKGEEDTDDIVHETLSSHRGLMLNVATITIATCGADNIGIYVPFFVTLSPSAIVIVLLTFLVMLTLFFIAGYSLVKVPIIAGILEKYGRWLTAAVYILIGLYIMVESGTLTKFLSLI
ncbi:cadmium resistance transporter [Pediococcus inopinatus]|uniref:CadD family cadmium resistance transporter n=1 Tax=Pediococcus inopinatus TaxID=114090 RepID=A0ABZ0Q1V9_9LACO|nr:cadmium resistance transporter [Pediococcus inopinatus]AVL00002.1 permease [Pediococcus inopinatus]KRN63562.1 cadmium binding protein [Pediococcus inopinatus]WPC19108.1 CadD family cadmium resistance transporter [Pediococcus inopinatus]WPC20896.1 CadD family cadmium resistance transporter [Pediococcus inopinatus]WPP10086.1 cadmium resistance transporter [Pediococcus inopinatus]